MINVHRNCGGALSMWAPVLFGVGGIVLAILVAGDIILASTAIKKRAESKWIVLGGVLYARRNGASTMRRGALCR